MYSIRQIVTQRKLALLDIIFTLEIQLPHVYSNSVLNITWSEGNHNIQNIGGSSCFNTLAYCIVNGMGQLLL